MKTLRSNPLAIPAIALLSLLIHRPVAWGQSQTQAIEMLASLPGGTYGHVDLGLADVRYELVDRHYAPTTYAPDALLRTIRQLENDRFEVRVVAADGTLRMSGAYRDAALQVPHGPFEYYYMDGQLESSGDYDLGNKSGSWERFSLDGRRLADRLYLGLSVEQIQVALGQSEEACTADIDR